VHRNIPDVHPAAVIATFHTNVRNRRMREKMNVKLPKTVNELYRLADKCARAEEGRRLPGEDAGAEVDSKDDDAATPRKKGRKRNRKRKGKTVMAVEGSGNPESAKKAKTESPGKEAAACTACQEAAANEKAGKSDGPYWKIHRTKGHDLQECRQVEHLVEKQKAKYEKRDKEKGQDGAGGSSKKGRGGRGGRHGKAKQQKERPARGGKKKEGDDGSEGEEDDDETSEQEFQKATDAMCVDGGASLHSSHRQLKQWAHEVNAAEPAPGSQKTLKWSHTPIIFDAEDHPDRITAVGCLPLLVSPTIRNLQVTKMLVDGGAGLNLFSPEVIKRLQIPDKELEKMGMFQGVNPGRSQPKGKITLPVTFGGELNYRTEKIVFDVEKIPLPYNGILGRPALAKFMAASHYAYNTLKMSGPMGVISVNSDKKDAVICVDKMYRDMVAAEAAKAPGLAKKKEKKNSGKTSSKDSGKRTSLECCAPVEDLLECSAGKKSKATALATKKVPAKEDGADGTFTISATLDSK
jgi:hypothetical protein